jgi:hypothetical protein
VNAYEIDAWNAAIEAAAWQEEQLSFRVTAARIRTLKRPYPMPELEPANRTKESKT